MNNKKVPSVVIKRLPRYYRYLGDLLDEGTEVESVHISDPMMTLSYKMKKG